MLIPWRFATAMHFLAPRLGAALLWTFKSREHYNYTYDLEPHNREYLCAFISIITSTPLDRIESYLRELDVDVSLKEHITNRTATSPERYIADSEVRFGRRAGWYAIIRATKPRLVVETGVDKGLGSCVIAAALAKNSSEGSPGRLVAVDLNPQAGYLLSPPYSAFGELIVEDSIGALAKVSDRVDVFIHDSEHSPSHEAKEYRAIESKLSPQAIVVSDNCEHSDELFQFARRTNRQFLFFAEKPLDHWWPGEGMGVAFRQT